MMETQGGMSSSTPRPTPSPFITNFNQCSPLEDYSRSCKRMKVTDEGKDASSVSLTPGSHYESKYKRGKSPSHVLDYTDPFSVPNLREELAHGRYGSVAKDILELRDRRMKMLTSLYTLCPSLSNHRLTFSPESSKYDLDTGLVNGRSIKVGQSTEVSHLADQGSNQLVPHEVVDLDDDCVIIDAVNGSKSIIEPPAEQTQEYSIQGVGNHGSDGHMQLSHVEIDSQNDNDRDVVVIDSDEEDREKQIEIMPKQDEVHCDQNILKQEENIAIDLSAASEANLKVPHQLQEVVLEKQVCYDQHILKQQENTAIDLIAAPKANRKASHQLQEVVLEKLTSEHSIKSADKNDQETKIIQEEQKSPVAEPETRKAKGVYVGVPDDLLTDKTNLQGDSDDGLLEMWREMSLAQEFMKDPSQEESAVGNSRAEEGEECEHSFVLKDDLGTVCRVCGVIAKSIDTIFEYQWSKGSKTTRTWMNDSRTTKDGEQNGVTSSGVNISQQELAVTEISAHPRHMKQMKPHQLEGFNFLVRNLIGDKPAGCILAHAPGSGKTFMVISFIQSFHARYPDARFLIVLPKGILGTWKKEFPRWQIEDMPLYDFYTTKAEKRSEQLNILKQWVERGGILILGYTQFSNIVCDSARDKTAASCHEILLKVPTVLILDEGHTPRNEDTNVLNSLAKVQTPRKVVLSGTLFQNHVKEVINILNLVQPRFLKLESSMTIRRRIMSRLRISGGRRQLKSSGGEAQFCELVEEALLRDDDFKGKVLLVQDLREMTRSVLHYYKGDFLDELPGLADFTVFLNLSAKQKCEVEKLKKMETFKRRSVGAAVYMHPHLKEFSETCLLGDKGCHFNEDIMDNFVGKIDFTEGVKAKYFLNLLGLCESSGEKLLVFSQYLLPLKFLERLVAKTKGWRLGKEIFMISGDSNQEQREWSMECFNSSADAKLFFGSIKACGEGISLVGASRVLILDVHLNPSVTRQAIGRAFRPGQVRKVFIYRLVAADSPDEDSHYACFRKEMVSKMWFEWSEYCGHKEYELETVDMKDSNDLFLESPSLGEDVKVLYKR